MQELTIGSLTCTVEYRSMDGDQGPAIRIFGEIDGVRKQLLRFDCFENDPHYHYDPTGKNLKFHLDRLTMGCPMKFSLRQITENTKEMIEKAGFSEIASAVDQNLLRERGDEIRQAIQIEQKSA